MGVRFDADGEDFTLSTFIDTTTISIGGWVRIDVDHDTYSTYWSVDDGSDALLLQTDTDGVTWTVWDNNTGYNSVVAATVGVWYFIFTVKNGVGTNSTTVYYAAASAASLSTVTFTKDQAVTGTNLRIGESHFTGEWLNGSIGPTYAYSGVALTADEVANLRLQSLPHRTTNLGGFWPFLSGGAVAGAQQNFGGSLGNLSNGTNSATTDGPPIPWRRGQSGLWLPAGVSADPFPAGYGRNLDFAHKSIAPL